MVVSEARVCLLAAILAAVIHTIVPSAINHFFPPTDPESHSVQPEGSKRDSVIPVGAQQDGRTGTFGQWMERDKGVVYSAETDGFVAAHTHGSRPADGFVIEVANQGGKLLTRTRAGRYDGTVCSVLRGDQWRVRSLGEGAMTVQWLPIDTGRAAD